MEQNWLWSMGPTTGQVLRVQSRGEKSRQYSVLVFVLLTVQSPDEELMACKLLPLRGILSGNRRGEIIAFSSPKCKVL